MPPPMRASLRGSSPPRQAMITTPKPKYRSRIALRWLGGRVKVAWGSHPSKRVARRWLCTPLSPSVHHPYTICTPWQLSLARLAALKALGGFARPAFIIHHSSFCIPKLSPVCLRCVSGESPVWPPRSRRIAQPPSLPPESLDVGTCTARRFIDHPGLCSANWSRCCFPFAQGRHRMDGGTESMQRDIPGAPSSILLSANNSVSSGCGFAVLCSLWLANSYYLLPGHQERRLCCFGARPGNRQLGSPCWNLRLNVSVLIYGPRQECRPALCPGGRLDTAASRSSSSPKMASPGPP